jgi:tetratricopeptide (TPR) repeat protein
MVKALESIEEYDRAAQAYRDYLKKHPDTEYKNMFKGGIAYYEKKQGNDDEAEKLFAQAVEGFEKEIEDAVASNDKVRNMAQLGKLYRLMDNDAKALEIYETILKDYPSDQHVPYIMLELATMYKTNKEYDKALGILNQIIRSTPRGPLSESAWNLIQVINKERQQAKSGDDTTTGPVSDPAEQKEQ